ncbi:P-loop NTPase fold protein [Candidatus Arthromitus sp. SFB-rat-Yit]|uniref:P-loop NTPase fold protein n=1 Tax=Candidatus Arthromitus sp. SFB-rat-Yit TaxID=1041504 RepID=UPI000227A363|nr:P-loop NTPase fold protein [Candidatus Arthromitus sp. SFB-rat-Yit]BAK80856.1 hypothetical protein RATSFB_0294 [Candidatus Arthromitus sp. SFB-rat-Yit]
MLYLCSLIIANIYIYIFLYIFRFKVLDFIKKFIFRLVPELFVVIYISFFMISIINSKIINSLSKTQIYNVANQINNIFFHKFYDLTLFDFIVILLCIYLIFIIIMTCFKKGYINKLRYLKCTIVYKYFTEIKVVVIIFYIVYLVLLYISREYFIYDFSHYMGIFTIFNIYFTLDLFLMMIELEFLLLPDLFENKVSKFSKKSFIKDDNYIIYDFNMMFDEKKHLFVELCNYLKYYHKEPLTICIDGESGVGKSTFSCVLQKELNRNYYVFNINSLIFTENNKLNDYFNYVIENLFKAYGIYNSKSLKNYMNIINYVMNDKVSNLVNYFMNDKIQKNYFEIKDEINSCIVKIFGNKSKSKMKKGIIFIIDDLERIYNDSQIVNILIFSQYILGFDYIKFILVTNLEILKNKIDNQYLDMFIHKIFKIDSTSTNDILSKYFGELNKIKIHDNDNLDISVWLTHLFDIEFDKYIKEFGVYLYNNVNLEYYILKKKWIEYKRILLEDLKNRGLLDSNNNITFNFKNSGYEMISEYYNYIYIKKYFLGDNREIILDNIYNLIKDECINMNLYDDEQVIAIWIYMEKNNQLSSFLKFNINHYRVYKNLTLYKNNMNKVNYLIDLKLDNSPRNLKRQVSFFLYSFEKLDKYLCEFKDNKNFCYILDIVNQRDFILFFMVICFFRVSNFIVYDSYDNSRKSDTINILSIYRFIISNYEILKGYSVKGITSFVYDNIDKIDIDKYINLKGFDKDINYIYLCFYIQTYIYKKLILEDVNEECFEILVKFICNLISV